jgi:hypothetical protein
MSPDVLHRRSGPKAKRRLGSKSQAVLGKPRYVKEVKRQYYDLNMAFGLKKGHINEATLSLQQACVYAGMSSESEEL